MSARKDVKNSFIFNPTGHGAGVWSGSGVTRTKPSRTLFLAAIPDAIDMCSVEQLFSSEPGFVGFRTVRRMAFVDFEMDRVATSAMRKFQNHKLPGMSHGLLIDYDKDPVAKRNRSYEMEKQAARAADFMNYYCICCHTRCIMLNKVKPLDAMPQRSTDSSFCVNEEKYLHSVNMIKGEEKTVKREKGYEKQYQLNCSMCSIPIAYRPEPAGVISKFLYVFAGGVTSEPRASTVKLTTVAAVPPPDTVTARSEYALESTSSSHDDVDIKRHKHDVLLTEEPLTVTGAAQVNDLVPVVTTDDADATVLK